MTNKDINYEEKYHPNTTTPKEQRFMVYLEDINNGTIDIGMVLINM